ncbi:MAG: fasciclin domain-containing protein [Odoribacter sp.]
MNDVARIISKDVEVTNGVIHVIDHVLDPILRTVKDVVDNEQNYTIFREALKLRYG